MRKIMLPIAGILMAAFAVTGCSEGKNVQWISMPLGGSCPGKDWDQIKSDKDGQQKVGALMCGGAGKAYAGEWRCKDGGIQVKCE